MSNTKKRIHPWRSRRAVKERAYYIANAKILGVEHNFDGRPTGYIITGELGENGVAIHHKGGEITFYNMATYDQLMVENAIEI